jgi:UDP-N-acetylmuramoyl-tripeptide--D-alanyl-D-alanine ligase
MVLEYGIDYPGEMLTLLSVVKPHIGIITCIDAVHSEQIGNPTNIAEEKRHMIDQALDVVFLNMDDVYINQMSDRTAADVLWYSIQQSSVGDV